MRKKPIALTFGLFAGLIAVSDATVVAFGQLGGNNTTVPANLGSRATTAGNGFVVSNGATPNIALTWDALWDIHTSTFFAGLENLTVGGGAWDNEGNIPRVGQLDTGFHTIDLAADPGFALVLNSFDFVHTAETSGTTIWNLTLVNSGSSVVWSETLTMNNAAPSTSLLKVTPNFTGAIGEDYTLTFSRTSETYTSSNGRHAIDNLSFNQAVPESSSLALLGLGATGLFLRRRRR